MDQVFIEGLSVDTIIGVYDWEREIRQTIVIDLIMATDVTKSAKNDDIADAIDYKAVSKRLINFIRGCEYQLIETLAEEISKIVLKEFGVTWLRLTLNKGEALSGARGVGVIIERTNRF